MFLAIGNSGSLQVFNKLQSNISDKIGDTQKLDISSDRSFPGDQDSVSIFSSVIGRELSHGSSSDLYLRWRMDFASNFFRTKAPHLVELGIPAVNTSDEVDILGTPVPESEGFRMDPICLHRIIFLEKQQRLELVRQV